MANYPRCPVCGATGPVGSLGPMCACPYADLAKEGGPVSEWQPIETAPKNPPGKLYGPFVLVFNQHNHVVYQARWAPVNQFSLGWAMFDGEAVPRGDMVSHWMPLPTPPEQAQ